MKTVVKKYERPEDNGQIMARMIVICTVLAITFDLIFMTVCYRVDDPANYFEVGIVEQMTGFLYEETELIFQIENWPLRMKIFGIIGILATVNYSVYNSGRKIKRIFRQFMNILGMAAVTVLAVLVYFAVRKYLLIPYVETINFLLELMLLIGISVVAYVIPFVLILPNIVKTRKNFQRSKYETKE